jgi:hypothetical protein
MATDKEIDAQFEQSILEALHSLSNGTITITKLNNQIVQFNIDETYNPVASESKKQRGHLTLIIGKDVG